MDDIFRKSLRLDRSDVALIERLDVDHARAVELLSLARGDHVVIGGHPGQRVVGRSQPALVELAVCFDPSFMGSLQDQAAVLRVHPLHLAASTLTERAVSSLGAWGLLTGAHGRPLSGFPFGHDLLEQLHGFRAVRFHVGLELFETHFTADAGHEASLS